MIHLATENQISQNGMEILPTLTSANSCQSTTFDDGMAPHCLDLEEWPKGLQDRFADQVKHFDSLERCLVWMTQQGLRFEASPAPPWLWLAILRLSAEAETLLDLCHTIIPRLPAFDTTTRNRLVALLIDRFAEHGMLSAIETLYRSRTDQWEVKDLAEVPSFSFPTKTHSGDEGELAILRALQRLVSRTDNERRGSRAQAELSRKLLATHVKHLAGTKSRVLTLPILDSLYFRKYLSKPLIKALEVVRRRRKLEQRPSWRRELFRYAVRRKDATQSLELLALLQADLACTTNIEEIQKTYRILLGSLQYIDPGSIVYQQVLNIQYTVSEPVNDAGSVGLNQEFTHAFRLAGAAYSRQVDYNEWQDLCRTLPQNVIQENLAVILKGYLIRDQAATAWKIWKRFYLTAVIDSPLILAVLKVLARLRKLDEAVQLVDACSRLSNSVVDKKIVNGLLRICADNGRVDYFQRIWEDMNQRWDIRPDEIALGNMLFATRIVPETRNTSFKQLVKRSFFSETSDIQMYDQNVQDPEPEESANAGSARVSSADRPWWQIPQGGRLWLDWKNARSLFRHILFRNHPRLSAVRSPLDGGIAGGIGSMVFGHRESASRLPPTDCDPAQILAELPIGSRHNDITYTADTFQSYISLLNKHNLGHEMALTLEWMRRLKVQPQRKSLCMVLLQVENSASPKQMRYRAGEQGWHKYALMTDGEWLRDWLVRWLGPKLVPTEDELADFYMNRWKSDNRSPTANAV
ncbi:hypothetical protein NliqN6_0710 [Naganishia liquefaciens]|uniref:Pentatricopeptide repeat domain-containing protein n=1 Tax=Naganishia liquefaciens TaxID=104408 RepID=A0A8H3YCL4_9TREE|nr:hypothetical protein NliqN6_0710 [Naganishia liquefaciens]